MPADEALLLWAAQRGDEDAFRSLVAVRRTELHAHCYRMLASFDDADDAVQDALLRAWRALPTFEHRSSLRTWLFKIATNSALDIASRRRRRELPIDLGPASGSGAPGGTSRDVAWIGPYPGATTSVEPEASYAARESIELAYVAALQFVPVHQRAVFILREALGFPASETARILDVSVASVNNALQRARRQLRDRLPTVSQAEELAALGDAAVRELAARYARAIEQADLDALLALLAEDASWSMPPLRSWYKGRADVSRFLCDFVFPERWLHRVTWANGQIAVAGYLYEHATNRYEAAALDVLDLKDHKIVAVTGFLTDRALSPEERVAVGAPTAFFPRFGLPLDLPA